MVIVLAFVQFLIPNQSLKGFSVTYFSQKIELQQGGHDVLPTGIALQKELRTVDKMLTSDIAFWKKIPKEIVEADAVAPPLNPIYIALRNGRQKYTTIKGPVLAVCAIPVEIDEIHREIRKNQLRKFSALCASSSNRKCGSLHLRIE